MEGGGASDAELPGKLEAYFSTAPGTAVASSAADARDIATRTKKHHAATFGEPGSATHEENAKKSAATSCISQITRNHESDALRLAMNENLDTAAADKPGSEEQLLMRNLRNARQHVPLGSRWR